jgi:oligopeptide/dipeptide ABC transporter ATP-binding protein
VVVLYAGRVVEDGPVDQVIAAPAHPYTAALLACAPELGRPEKPLAAIAGQPPPPDPAIEGAVSGGCRFAPRCPQLQPACREAEPPLSELVGPHRVRCLFPLGSPEAARGAKA